MTDQNTPTNTSEYSGQANIGAFESELRQQPDHEPLELSQRVLDNVAFHDFAFYDYLIPTEKGYNVKPGLSAAGINYMRQLEAAVPAEQLDILASFLVQLEESLRQAVF
ncbi:MAG: hypothetical protein R3293_27395, partial [Candidatus Promineifilaceae bacterium]|nr:hypothetical protein [Candidatus Promineifilaceae bacterium]